MEIIFSEITNTKGNINKTITVSETGAVTKSPNATVSEATCRTVKIPAEEVTSYLQGLNAQADKAIILGVWPDVRFDEYNIVTADSGEVDPDNGVISRSKKYFQYANSDSISLALIDIDGNWPETEINSFLYELNEVISDALLDSSVKHSSFAYWSKPSCGAACRVPGKPTTDRHIYLPVKNCTEELIELIAQFAWLRKTTRTHKISSNGAVLIRTIMDASTASPERIVFEADPNLLGHVEIALVQDRDCYYHPGAALDCELACMCLREVTGTYQTEVADYKRSVVESPEYKAIQADIKSKRMAEYMANGASPKAAAKMAEDNSRGIILSGQFLIKSDMTKILALDVLTDPFKWDKQTHFNDFDEPRQGHNCAMIQFRDDGQCYLYTQRHGGSSYCLKFTFEDLYAWANNAEDGELDDYYIEFSARCDMTATQMEKLAEVIRKKIGVSKASVAKDLKSAEKTRKIITLGAEENDIGVDTCQIDLAEHYLSKQNECKAYADNLYVWNGGTIWERKSSQIVFHEVGVAYKASRYCRTAPNYSQIMKCIYTSPKIAVEEWPSFAGFPCSDGFYLVGPNVPGFIECIPYTKELGCRHKLKIKPDYTVLTPMFDKVVKNTTDPVLFQQLFGLLLCGYLRELQKVAVFFGDGGSGKGTTERVLKAMLPKRQISKVDLKMMNRPEGRVALADSVINIISEITRTDKPIDIEGLKMITGGDDVSSRKLYSDYGNTFTPKCSQLITINDWPRLDASGIEVSRRFAETIVRFVRSQEEDVVGIDDAIIKNELPGVLAWAVEGVRHYFENGFKSEESTELFKLWTASFDPMHDFLQECCRFGDKRGDDRVSVVKADLWKAFTKYCTESGMSSEGGPPVMRKQDFNAAIEKNSKVTLSRTGDRGAVYKGIALLPKK